MTATRTSARAPAPLPGDADAVQREFDALFATMSARLESNIAQVGMGIAAATVVFPLIYLARGGRITMSVLLVASLLFAWYFLEWFLIRKGLYRWWFRYIASTIEVSIPTIGTLLHNHAQPALYAQTSAAIVLYPVTVAASTLRLDPKLCLFAGAFSSLQFLAVFTLVAPPASIPELAPLFSASLPGTLLKAFYILATGIFGMIATIGMRRLLARVTRSAVERERLRGIFGVYVSEEIVEQILAKGGLEEGGERRRVTVCCTDIRGFTSLSETRPPEELVKLLNVYFDRMCGIVAKHGGVVNKFLGDGMLIVFGAPNRLEDDARSALAAAREMVAEAHRLFATGEFPGLRIGIGLHRGDAVVGNVGGSQRREYTVIGDTVNTAFRIEGLTKLLGRSILVTGDVRAALDGEALEPLGAHLVKGREAAVELFSPAEAS